MLRQDDFTKAQLVLTGWRWGRPYGGHLAACMVMSCLANRQRLGWGSWLAVLDGIPRFAAVTEMPTGTPELYDPSFVHLLHDVEGIYDGTMDHAKGATFWCDTRYVETPFFRDKILGDREAHPRVCDMGTLTLFR